MVLPTSSPNTEGTLGTKPVFLVTKLVRGYEKIFFLCIVDLNRNLKCACLVSRYHPSIVLKSLLLLFLFTFNHENTK